MTCSDTSKATEVACLFETKDTGSHDASISKEECEAYATSIGYSFENGSYGNSQSGPAYGCFQSKTTSTTIIFFLDFTDPF